MAFKMNSKSSFNFGDSTKSKAISKISRMASGVTGKITKKLFGEEIPKHDKPLPEGVRVNTNVKRKKSGNTYLEDLHKRRN